MLFPNPLGIELLISAVWPREGLQAFPGSIFRRREWGGGDDCISSSHVLWFGKNLSLQNNIAVEATVPFSNNCSHMLTSHSFNSIHSFGWKKKFRSGDIHSLFDFFYLISNFFFFFFLLLSFAPLPVGRKVHESTWETAMWAFPLFFGAVVLAGSIPTLPVGPPLVRITSFHHFFFFCFLVVWHISSDIFDTQARAQVHGGQWAEYIQSGPRQRDLEWACDGTDPDVLLEDSACN